MTPAPVDETAARLAALDDYAGFSVRPGAGWVSLAAADGFLDRWLALLIAEHGGRNVAGSTLGSALAAAVIGPTVGSMLLDRRCPDPAPANLTALPSGTGEFDARGVRTGRIAVLAVDPAAAHPDSVVLPDEKALDEWWAVGVAATLTPLFEAVRTRAPFGLRNLWGLAADDVTATSLWLAELAGRDQQAAWTRAQRLLDALARHAPIRFLRSRPFPVGERLHQVRGTCCLYYRSTCEPGPPAENRCDTCPLRDDDSRRERLLAYP
ncbi:(2Fe-2S)-binding protein [Actinoplanes sp. TRM 88003]|uniref:(2Fe-2S)-binding protein n=1 Tax=Paractinoplanes aksuensis TaxID=2939490 RepID=A0ABT1E1Q3_9ACTN|nr:(2Fe-2S)-binding protein [Actinoplanes aksuensis]MCO8277052.1 (2Fe-2S)-binding protein [Actinoplanes aksuensis]